MWPRPADDEIVTTFCDRVTPERKATTARPRSLAIKAVGEAMAPASGSHSSGGKHPGAGAEPSTKAAAGRDRFVASRSRLLPALSLAVLVGLAGCADDAPPTTATAPVPEARVAAADPGQGLTTELDGVEPEVVAGTLAELTGDEGAARAAFEHALGSSAAPSSAAARAALHLARLEARAGKRRQALDLAARAAALAPSDVAIADGIAELRADVVAASAAGDVRGPAVGTVLVGVSPQVAAAFAVAERSLAAVHGFQPRAFDVLLGAKEDAIEGVVARYRKLVDAGGLAQVAADYRIGSLYHDLGLSLLFAPLPPGFDPSVQAGLRDVLRGRALAYCKRAAASYRATLAGPASPDAELWRLAAESDLRTVIDVLREAGEREDAP
jgi:hypothetical protein